MKTMTTNLKKLQTTTYQDLEKEAKRNLEQEIAQRDSVIAAFNKLTEELRKEVNYWKNLYYNNAY